MTDNDKSYSKLRDQSSIGLNHEEEDALRLRHKKSTNSHFSHRGTHIPEFEISPDDENINNKVSDVESKSVIKKQEESIMSMVNDETLDIKDTINEITSIAIPSALSYICIFVQQTINLSFVGHTADKENEKAMISGIGVANLYLNCTVMAIAIGLLNGFNVLGGNAVAQKKYRLFGLYFQRSILIAYCFAFTIVVLHFFTIDKGLHILGADENSLKYGESYGKISMFFVFFEILFNSSFRYLNIARKTWVINVVLIVTTLLHPLWCYLLMIVMNFGIQGAAIALVLSQCLTGITLLLFIIISKPINNSVFCICRDTFKSWGRYLAIAIPSTFLLCFEWWAFEFQSIIAINCPKESCEDDYATQVLTANLFMLLLALSIGFFTSSSIMCSKLIAQNRLKDLKKFVLINGLYSLAVFLVIFAFLMIFRSNVYYIFTNEETIIEKGIDVLPLLLSAMLFNNLKGTIQGLLVGLRKQFLASVVSFTAYYIVQIGLSLLFVIKLNWGVVGIWVAELIGYIFIDTVYLIYLSFCVDYKKAVEETIRKLCMDQMAINNKSSQDKKSLE